MDIRSTQNCAFDYVEFHSLVDSEKTEYLVMTNTNKTMLYGILCYKPILFARQKHRIVYHLIWYFEPAVM